jgi:hypothetical protein
MTASADHPRRPVITFGAAPGRLGNVGRDLDIARNADLIALDLDLREAWAMPRVKSLTQASLLQPVRLRSIWLPQTIVGMMAARRTNALAELLGAARQDFGLRSLIVPRQRDGSSAERQSEIHQLARDLVNQKSGSTARLVVGLHAGDFRHDRWHLDQLAGIRRMAEEWDLDLALDLTGNVSLAWEAEAAVLRVLPRLTLVRLGQWRRPDGSLVSNQTGQIAGRTISMLADQGYSGVISLVPEARSQAAASAVISFQKNDVLQRFVPTQIDQPDRIDTPINDFTRRDL